MTIPENANAYVNQEDENDGFADYADLLDSDLEKISLRVKEMTPNVEKIRRSGEVMKCHEVWMNNMKRIREILEKISPLAILNNADDTVVSNIDTLLDCFEAVHVLHDDDRNHSEFIRRQAFIQLRGAYGLSQEMSGINEDEDNDQEYEPIKFQVDSVDHLIHFTRFLREKVRESVYLIGGLENAILPVRPVIHDQRHILDAIEEDLLQDFESKVQTFEAGYNERDPFLDDDGDENHVDFSDDD